MKVPKDWVIHKLETVAEIQTGIAKGAHDAAEMVSLPYLRVANVQDGHVDLSEMKEMEVPAGKVSRFLLQRGDLLMTEGGDFDKLGRGCLWQGQIDPCLHQNHVFAVRVTSPALHNQFLAILAASPYGRRYFTGCSKQSTNLASINTSQLRAFPVLMPPLPEQRRIAEILGSWDRAIETQQKLLTAKTARLRTLRHQLLTGAKRFPEFKQKWRKVRLDAAVEVLSSNVDKKTVAGETPVRLCNYTDVYYRSVITDDLPFMEATASEREIEKFTLHPQDVMITKDSEDPLDIAVSAVVTEPLRNVLCGYHLALLRPYPEMMHGEFLHEALHTKELRNQFSAKANGVTRYGLTLEGLGSVIVPVPPLPEQTRIAAVLNACQREINLLTTQLEALKQQKRGMMQKLLTGEVRVAISKS